MPLDRAKTILIAEKFVKAGKLPEAAKEYQKVAEDNPRDMNVMNKLGDLLVRAGRNAEALRYFVRIADFYARDGFFLKAIAMYKKVTKLDPSNIESQQRLAAMYKEQGLATEAKAQYLQLADHLVRHNQAAGAIEALKRVLEIDPENPKVRMTLAEMLARGGKAEDAAREFCALSRTAAARGDMTAAVESLRRSVQASPGLPDLPGQILALVVRVEAAPAALVTAAEAVASHAKRSALAQLVLGETRRRSGRGAEAEQIFKRLAAGGDTDDDLTPEALAILVRHHVGQGHEGEAWALCERAIGRSAAGGGFDAVALIEEFLTRHPEHLEALAKRAALIGGAVSSAPGAEAHKRPEPAPAAEAPAPRAHREPPVAAPEPVHPKRPPEPVPVAAEEEDEIEVILVESDEPAAPPPPDAAKGEPSGGRRPVPAGVPVAAAAIEGTVDLEPEEEESLSPPGTEDEAYGPASRIQEIQDSDAKGQPVDEDFISEHLTEAEVFVKYGLHGKAREQLQAVLDRYPDHDVARIRLKDILVAEGNNDAAIRECLAIADILRGKGREAEAREVTNEAVRLNPDSPLVARHRGAGAPPAAEPPAPAAPRKAPARPAPVSTAPAYDPLAIDEEPEEIPAAGPPPRSKRAAAGEDWLSADKASEIEVAASETRGSPADDPPPDFAATTARTSVGRPKPAKSQPAAKPEPPPETFAASDEDSLADLMTGLQDAPSAPSLVAPARKDPDDEKLGEVDFYIEQGLVDEARQVLFQLSRQYPGSAAVAERQKRVEVPAGAPAAAAKGAGAEDLDFEVEQALAGKSHAAAPSRPAAPTRPAAPEPPPRAGRAKPVFKLERHSGDGDFVDLGAEISRTLSEAMAADPAVSETLDGQAHSFDDIFAAFKKGVEQQVESDDFETHYNLGIAYKEMGLVDEAIGEFQFAARDPSRALECCGILGLCFRDKGMPDLALKWYRRGLDMPGLDEHQSLGLRYDMAEVFREQGAYAEALKAYTDVYGVDSTYRDVTARIKEMKSQVAGAKR